MSTRKPVYMWKTRGCAEVSENFTVPFAIKEYMQNQVGQILKEKKTREWGDWHREDLRGSTSAERRDRKVQLAQAYPGLLTGTAGAYLKRTENWEPIFILSGTVRRAELVATTYGTDLKICTVMWKNVSSGATGFTFFNNHLDQNARFSAFVIDGMSTSKKSEWAVGEKGKGFALATQYLFEEAEKNIDILAADEMLTGNSKPKPKVSFRVGHQVGELSWKVSRFADEDDILQVKMDDLSPVDATEFLLRRAATAKDWNSDDEYEVTECEKASVMKTLQQVYKRRFTQQLAIKKPEFKELEASQPDHEHSFVTADEVCIVILDLDRNLTPEIAFHCTYGVIEPPQSWRVANTLFTFFKPFDKPHFYHRDQLVPAGLPLNTIGINYHGDLQLTSDRVSVIRPSARYSTYLSHLADAADKAIRTIPELAVLLALDMSTSKDDGPGTIIHELKPGNDSGADAYRTAFITAWRILNPDLPADRTLFPCTPGSSDVGLVRELGMIDILIKSINLRYNILYKSGAFKLIEDHARSLLISSPSYAGEVVGFDRFQEAITYLLPSVDSHSIVLRDYTHSSPKVVWDATTKAFSVALPGKCDSPDHKNVQCLCWVGPYLDEAIAFWTSKQKTGVEAPSKSAKYRAYARAMDGAEDMVEKTVAVKQPSASNVTEPAKPSGSGPAIVRPMTLDTLIQDMKTLFDNEILARKSVTTLADTRRSELLEARTAIAKKQSLIEAKETEIATVRKQLAEQHGTLRSELHEARTAITVKQTFINAKEIEITAMKKQLAEQQETIDGLEEPMSAMTSLLGKIVGNKRKRTD